jgi:hypothetical protein
MGQTTEETVHHLDLDIGSIRVAMKRHGLAEPIPPRTSNIPMGSYRMHHGSDGILATLVFLTRLMWYSFQVQLLSRTCARIVSLLCQYAWTEMYQMLVFHIYRCILY